MSIFSKIVTAIRGGASEAGEAIVDANLMRILDQEIRDAKEAMEKSRRGLTELMAEKSGYERKAAELNAKISEYEGHALSALEKGEEAIALEVAEKIAEFQGEVEYNEGAITQLQNTIVTQKEFLTTSERKVKDLAREAKMARTTETVQKTAAALSTNFTASGSKLNSARSSLDRIKARQQKNADQLKAGEALAAEATGASLEAKLSGLGITKTSSKGGDILAQLKAKKKG